MFSVGLVLSAGGDKGDPWHSAVVSSLASVTGWDARHADLIVGTSAGSITATALRAGLSPADCEARHLRLPLSDEGRSVVGRITTPYDEPQVAGSNLPSAPKMSLRAAWPPWKADPVRLAYGLLPDGKRSGAAIRTRVNELLPDGWPAEPTWIVAVRTNDGRRVVFGRDDVNGSPGAACQASSAIPVVYTPVTIGTRKYVDGAVHSSTNADLVAMLGFDLVIISSVKSAVAGARSWTRDPERAWFSTKLDAEVEAIRSSGTPVVVIEPTADELELISARGDNIRQQVCRAGRQATERVLAGRHSDGVRSLLNSANFRSP